ncbi:MAG TPA: DUF308 domain-containing protein [Candidatus Acidoferrum sp.]|nr:DUF308 domain-containing protein [Candidatus Acidoferrum sp.]
MATAVDTATTTAAQAASSRWWLTLIKGIIALVIGAVMLWGSGQTKVDTYLFLVVFLGIWWMLDGIINIVSIFIDHTMWGWRLFLGIVSVIAGSYIVMYPYASALALPKVFVLVLGIWGLMYGIMLLIMGFRGAGWGAGILGALGILFGLALIGNYTAFGMGLSMIWAAAVSAVVLGIVAIVMAFRERNA